MPSKYKAQATVVDGIRFHSKRESQRYAELKLLEKAGEIAALSMQVRMPLWVPTPEGGYARKVIGHYVADFRYLDLHTNRERTEDVKGFSTELAKWKIKHVEAQYGITVEIIK